MYLHSHMSVRHVQGTSLAMRTQDGHTEAILLSDTGDSSDSAQGKPVRNRSTT
jgi:hypothetical protein